VDLFFALSGFLITSLLVTEWDARRSIDCRAFYWRRALRLLPALGLMVLTLTSLGVAGGQPGVLVQALVGVSYVTNFVQAAAPQPELFSHLWSLAEEEQFYLLWPLLLLLLLRRKARPQSIVLMLVGLASASFIERGLLAIDGDPLRRLWFAPDTHADAIILGSAAGVAWTYGLFRVSRLGGFVAMAVLIAISSTFSLDNRMLYVAPLGLFAVASAMVVTALVDDATSPLSRLLSQRPLRWLGRVSYGLYLWHLPMFLLAGPLVGSGLAIVLSAMSYRYVERPILRRRSRPRHWVVPDTRTVAPA
jgi:peptidoglycan/LPS O-acetylase OafA/YrhL